MEDKGSPEQDYKQLHRAQAENLRESLSCIAFFCVFQLIVLVFWPADKQFWLSLTAHLFLMPSSETPGGILNHLYVFHSTPNNIQKQHLAAEEPNVSLRGRQRPIQS